MTTPQPELREQDFINEEYSKNPLPLWLWFFLLTTLIALIWGTSNWYGGKLAGLVRTSPFLQVTNRDFSLFLWQNPEFMRINAKNKNGYLPAFLYMDKVTIDLPHVDDNVSAPPELLFRYHTWHRLISPEFTQRPIPKKEFSDFLSYVEEWQPPYWPAAPKEYVHMVAHLSSSQLEDLSTLSLSILPMEVRMAFQGWKNYFLEGEEINALKPTIEQTAEFLSSHPHFARNYWCNIVRDRTPDYLKSLMKEEKKTDAALPKDEITSFFRVGIYNYLKSNQPTTSVQ